MITYLVLPHSQHQLLKALHVHQVKDRAPDCQGDGWEGWLHLCLVHELLDLCDTPGPQGGADGDSDGGSDPSLQDPGVRTECNVLLLLFLLLLLLLSVQRGQVINRVVTQETKTSREPGTQSRAWRNYHQVKMKNGHVFCVVYIALLSSLVSIFKLALV